MCLTEETRPVAQIPTIAFCFDFEGQRLSTADEAVTPPEIRAIVGGIPADVPIAQVLEDGTQLQLHETDEVKLDLCSRFRRVPRFIRGRR